MSLIKDLKRNVRCVARELVKSITASIASSRRCSLILIEAFSWPEFGGVRTVKPQKALHLILTLVIGRHFCTCSNESLDGER